jgi:hypothetical protein
VFEGRVQTGTLADYGCDHEEANVTHLGLTVSRSISRLVSVDGTVIAEAFEPEIRSHPETDRRVVTITDPDENSHYTYLLEI